MVTPPLARETSPMLTYTSVVPSGIVCRALNSAKVYGFAAVPSPPSARSLERRREKAARFPRTCSVLQSGYIPLHFAALPTLPRNNPEITSLPVCANAAQTGWRDGLGPVSRMKRGGPGGTAFRVVPASSLHAGAVPASPSRMCSSGCGFAPCGSGPGSVGGVFSRRRGRKGAFGFLVGENVRGKAVFKRKRPRRGPLGEPSPQAFGPVRRRGPSRP